MIRAIFDFSPIPNQTRKRVMNAIGGINRIKLRKGSITIPFTFQRKDLPQKKELHGEAQVIIKRNMQSIYLHF
jgi:hypothetical protein